MLFPCFTFIPKTGVMFFREAISFSKRGCLKLLGKTPKCFTDFRKFYPIMSQLRFFFFVFNKYPVSDLGD